MRGAFFGTRQVKGYLTWLKTDLLWHGNCPIATKLHVGHRKTQNLINLIPYANDTQVIKAYLSVQIRIYIPGFHYILLTLMYIRVGTNMAC